MAKDGSSMPWCTFIRSMLKWNFRRRLQVQVFYGILHLVLLAFGHNKLVALDFVEFKSSSLTNKQGIPFETSTTVLTVVDPTQLKDAIKYTQKELKAVRKKNPKAKVEILCLFDNEQGIDVRTLLLLNSPKKQKNNNQQAIRDDEDNRNNSKLQTFTNKHRRLLKSRLKRFRKQGITVRRLLSDHDLKSLASHDLTDLKSIAEKIGKDTVPIYANPKNKDLLPKSSMYNHVFTIIRGITIGTTVTFTLVISKNTAPLMAAPIGLLAGSMSATLQFFNQQYLSWLRSKSWFGITKERSSLPQTYVKDSMVILTYMSVLHMGMVALDIKPELFSLSVVTDILRTVALSVYSESTWSIINADILKKAINKKPHKEKQYRRYSNAFALFQSMIITGIQVMDLAGLKIGSISLGTVGIGGFAVYLWKCANLNKLTQQARELWKQYIARPCNGLLRRS